jgi:hypothetical protein
MSITDELREYVQSWRETPNLMDDLDAGDIDGLLGDFIAIADRIDAEHERQCAESWMRGHDAWAAIDRSDEMAEHGWVRLPKDADGEYIRIGDVMDFTKNVRGLTVLGIGIADANESSYGVFVREGNDYVWYNAEFLHHHVQTVEDILREFALTVCKDDALTIRKDVVEEYAKRLTLAEVEDA